MLGMSHAHELFGVLESPVAGNQDFFDVLVMRSRIERLTSEPSS